MQNFNNFGSSSNPGHGMNAYQNRDQGMAMMGFKGVINTANKPTFPANKEQVDMLHVKMPKMEVKNAPNHPVWNRGGGH